MPLYFLLMLRHSQPPVTGFNLARKAKVVVKDQGTRDQDKYGMVFDEQPREREPHAKKSKHKVRPRTAEMLAHASRNTEDHGLAAARRPDRATRMTDEHVIEMSGTTPPRLTDMMMATDAETTAAMIVDTVTAAEAVLVCCLRPMVPCMDVCRDSSKRAQLDDCPCTSALTSTGFRPLWTITFQTAHAATCLCCSPTPSGLRTRDSHAALWLDALLR
jgi:hypothetical protein